MAVAASTIREMRFSSASTSHCTLTNDRWIGRDGPTAWPPWSPDLTPMNYFVWGHIKPLIYTSPVDSEANLIARIVEAAATIRQQTGILECTRQSVLRRCRLCIEVGVRTFEHPL